MRLQRITAAVIAAAFLLSGCSSLSLSGNDILTPPKAAGHRAEVQRIIEKDAGGGYTLIYPDGGDYKSGIILRDIDRDGTEEAIALYDPDGAGPRLLTAVQQDGIYQLYGSVSLPSANVSALSFADFDADGREELVVSFDAGSSLAALNAYFFTDAVTEMSIAQGYADYVIGDFDGNSTVDVLVMQPADGDTAAQAALTVYADGAFSEKSTCRIDSDVISYVNLRFDRLSDNIEGAVADGLLDDGRYTTQLLYYDSAAHLLLNPLFQNSSYGASVRNSAVICTDVDDDGIIEVPLCGLTPYAEDEDTDTVCTAARWSDYDPELMALAFKQDAILCEKLGFMLTYSGEAPADVTARYTAENAVTLYEISYRNEEPVKEAELLTIKRYAKGSYDSSLTAQAVLYENAAYLYTYILGEGSPLTHEDIENSFVLLEAE